MKRKELISQTLLSVLIIMVMFIEIQSTFSAPVRADISATPTVASVTTSISISTTTPVATINDPGLLPQVGTTRPIATINDPKLLPQAITATASPYKSNRPSKSSLNPENQALLDNAVSNSFSSSGLQFAIKALVNISTKDEAGSLQIEGTGYAGHLDDLQKFVFQNNLTVTFDLDGTKRVANVEERIINEMFYLYAEEPAAQTRTKWIGISFSDVLLKYFRGFGQFVPSVEGVTKLVNDKVPDPSAFLDLLSFGSYLNTTRIDTGGSTAQFRTQYGLLDFLKSKDDLTAALRALAQLGSIDLESTQIAGVVTVFQQALPFLIPSLRMTTDTFVDTNNGTVSRFALDFRTTFEFGDLSKLKMQSVALTVNGTVFFKNYGKQQEVDVPTDVVIVTDLDNIPIDDLRVPMITTTVATEPSQ